MEGPMDRPSFPVTVFYDGGCAVCRMEIEHYLRRDRRGSLEAIDIADPGFDPVPYGIPFESFMAELHVIDREGVVYTGVAAFRAIWQAFPDAPLYRFAAAFLGLPLVNPVARLCYRGFAAVRPYFPGASRCEGGSCRIGRH